MRLTVPASDARKIHFVGCDTNTPLAEMTDWFANRLLVPKESSLPQSACRVGLAAPINQSPASVPATSCSTLPHDGPSSLAMSSALSGAAKQSNGQVACFVKNPCREGLTK